MARWKVLVSAPYMLPVVDEFRSTFAEHDVEVILLPVDERLSEAELLLWIGDIDGVICGDDRFTERVLQSAPHLKVISKWGTGIDSIDREAAERLGILVCNTPNAFTDAVADSVLGYMLCFARQIPVMDREMRSGKWNKLAGFSLGEKTLGIIGLGRVGRAVARRASVFGMQILGNDIVRPPDEFLAESGVELTDKERLLSESDFVSLNCDLNPTSFHIVGGRELALMRLTAYLINTARGPLIDEPALARALQEGDIAGAALDVFEVEPLPEDSELRKLDNCLLAPHNANSSPEAHRRVHEHTVRNLLDGLYARDREP